MIPWVTAIVRDRPAKSGIRRIWDKHGICDGQSGTDMFFTPSALTFSCQHHLPVPHAHIHSPTAEAIGTQQLQHR